MVSASQSSLDDITCNLFLMLETNLTFLFCFILMGALATFLLLEKEEDKSHLVIKELIGFDTLIPFFYFVLP